MLGAWQTRRIFARAAQHPFYGRTRALFEPNDSLVRPLVGLSPRQWPLRRLACCRASQMTP